MLTQYCVWNWCMGVPSWVGGHWSLTLSTTYAKKTIVRFICSFRLGRATTNSWYSHQDRVSIALNGWFNLQTNNCQYSSNCDEKPLAENI